MDDPSDPCPLSEKKCTILAKASSFTPDGLLAVISASVSRKVLTLRVQAGPMSFKILATPPPTSLPSKGVRLSIMPEVNAPKEFGPEVLFVISSMIFSAFFFNCDSKICATISDVSIPFSL
jgi:hypothetical protein